MKKKTAIILALTLALGAGASYYYYPQLAANLPFSPRQAETTSYQTANLSRGNIESLVNATGTLNPVVTVSVGSELSGTIVELNADFNSQLMLRISRSVQLYSKDEPEPPRPLH